MSKKVRNVAIFTGLAAAAGYVAGILTAPKSGKETRQDIADAAVRAKQQAEKQLKHLHSELSELIVEVKKKTQNASEAVKKEVDKALKQATVAKETARNLLSSIHEGDGQDEDLQAAVKEAKRAIAHLKEYVGKNTPDQKK